MTSSPRPDFVFLREQLTVATEGLDAASVAQLVQIATALAVPIQSTVDAAAGLVVPEFQAEFEARLKVHHATHSKQLDRISFEDAFTSASRAAGRTVRGAAGATAPVHRRDRRRRGSGSQDHCSQGCSGDQGPHQQAVRSLVDSGRPGCSAARSSNKGPDPAVPRSGTPHLPTTGAPKCVELALPVHRDPDGSVYAHHASRSHLVRARRSASSSDRCGRPVSDSRLGSKRRQDNDREHPDLPVRSPRSLGRS